MKKKYKSLDFYDVYKILCAASTGRFYLKFDSGRISMVDPKAIDVSEKIKVESALNFTFQKMDDENINEKIRSLENRLKNVENRLDKLEKQ